MKAIRGYKRLIVEAIVNGDFSSGSLEPGWSACSRGSFNGRIIGPDEFNRCWIFPFALELMAGDCVEQEFEHPIIANGDLRFRGGLSNFEHYEPLHVRTFYADGTEDNYSFTSDTAGDERFEDCYGRSVPVRDDKELAKFQFRAGGDDRARNTWHITQVSLQKITFEGMLCLEREQVLDIPPREQYAIDKELQKEQIEDINKRIDRLEDMLMRSTCIISQNKNKMNKEKQVGS